VSASRLLTFAHLTTALATLFLVGVTACGILEAKRALELSERAWITPGTSPPFLARQPERNEPIRFVIPFLNTGKEPAFDLVVAIDSFTIEPYNTEMANIVDVVVPKNNSCDNLKPVTGRAVFPPSPVNTNYAIFEDSIHGQPPLRVENQILNGTRFYGVNACFAYNTFGKPHHTGVCFILTYGQPQQPQPQQPQPQQQQPQPTPQFQFGPCASGFNAD
jgi:hypothetical protein